MRNNHVTLCADCDMDVTMVNTHECKEQRAANRRAQRKNEIRIAELRAAHRRNQERGR